MTKTNKKQENITYIDNTAKWKGIATIGIWLGVGIGSIYGTGGNTLIGAGCTATIIMWLFG